MNPPWKMQEVFVLVIHQVIRIHFNKWEVVVVCRPKTPTWRGMRIFVLIMIQIHFDKWEVVVCCPRRGVRIFVLIISQVIVVVVCGPRRGLKLLKDIDIQTNYCIVAMIPDLQTTWIPLRFGCGSINGPLIAPFKSLREEIQVSRKLPRCSVLPWKVSEDGIHFPLAAVKAYTRSNLAKPRAPRTGMCKRTLIKISVKAAVVVKSYNLKVTIRSRQYNMSKLRLVRPRIWYRLNDSTMISCPLAFE